MKGNRNPHVAKTVYATIWLYSGRGLGLLWTAALIHRLGITEYGKYAMAFALASIIGATLDNYFFVGSVRSTHSQFLADRSTRFYLGFLLLLLGGALFRDNLVVGLGLMFAGAEIVTNAYLSNWMRSGNPDLISGFGMIRQTASITAGIAYLYLASNPGLAATCLLYVAPYLVILTMAFARVRHDKPGLQKDRKQIPMLLADAFCGSVYGQGDVLLLGLITSERTAGYYSVAAVSAGAASSIGMSFAQTFHEKFRSAAGDPAAGPSRANSMLLSVGVSIPMLVVGLVLAAVDASPQLWASFIILSVFTAMRSFKHMLTLVLIVQRRDKSRVIVVAICALAKAAMIALLARYGAVGAALAASVAEAVLVISYFHLVYPRHTFERAQGATRPHKVRGR